MIIKYNLYAPVVCTSIAAQVGTYTSSSLSYTMPLGSGMFKSQGFTKRGFSTRGAYSIGQIPVPTAILIGPLQGHPCEPASLLCANTVL